MSLGELQFFDIIIFAGIAAFLIFRLRNVLGKRAGFHGNDNGIEKKTVIEEHKTKKNIPELENNISELRKAYEALDNFDHKNFLDGAKIAFETILNAFNKKDTKTLKKLLTDDVFKVFEQAINNNDIDSENQIFSLNVDKIESVKINQGKIIIKIKFISEKFKNNDESTIRKNEDTWTFEKPLQSKNPNWLLSST